MIMETFIGCSILMQNDRNQVLIAQRSKTKKSYPLMWETVGGALEPGETPEQCIRREVLEELNSGVIELQLFQVYVIEQVVRYVLIVFTGRPDRIIRHNSEIEQVRWIDRSKINDYNFYGNEKEKLSDFFAASSLPLDKKSTEYSDNPKGDKKV